MKQKADRYNPISPELIFTVTNPSVLSVLLLLLIAFNKSHHLSETAIWMVSIICIVYFDSGNICLFRMHAKAEFIRNQFSNDYLSKKTSLEILILSFYWDSMPGILILLKAPPILLTTVVALLAGSIVTACLISFTG